MPDKPIGVETQKLVAPPSMRFRRKGQTHERLDRFASSETFTKVDRVEIRTGDLGGDGLGAASKLNADSGFLWQLRTLGRERAQAWIDDHFDDLGVRSTVDIQAAYL